MAVALLCACDDTRTPSTQKVIAAPLALTAIVRGVTNEGHDTAALNTTAWDGVTVHCEWYSTTRIVDAVANWMPMYHAGKLPSSTTVLTDAGSDDSTTTTCTENTPCVATTGDGSTPLTMPAAVILTPHPPARPLPCVLMYSNVDPRPVPVQTRRVLLHGGE